MKALFIGGPKAGQMVEVDIRASFVDVPHIQKTAAFTRNSSDPVNCTLLRTRYQRDRATSKEGIIYPLFVAEGSGDPLLTLMQFYANGDHSVERDK